MKFLKGEALESAPVQEPPEPAIQEVVPKSTIEEVVPEPTPERAVPVSAPAIEEVSKSMSKCDPATHKDTPEPL